jgi:SAM-dependent methyltransferase
VLAYPEPSIAWARLATYLGDRFDPALTDFDTLRRFLDQEWHQLGPDFYRRSVGYLYDLTHFHFATAKRVFFETVVETVDDQKLARIADIGCGVALDAQALLQAGYDVHGYDLDNPSLAYARWRLARDCGASRIIHPIDDLAEARYDLVYAVDVIGHTPKPSALVARLMNVGAYVVVNLHEHARDPRFGPDDLHPSLDHAAVLAAFQEHGTLIRLTGGEGSTVTVWRSNRV